MKKIVIVLLLGVLLGGSIAYATSRDQVLMATKILEIQRDIVKDARSNATRTISKVTWLKAQYNDADKKDDIDAGLLELGVTIAPLVTELNAVETNMQDILDNTTAPKVIE